MAFAKSTVGAKAEMARPAHTYIHTYLHRNNYKDIVNFELLNLFIHTAEGCHTVHTYIYMHTYRESRPRS